MKQVIYNGGTRSYHSCTDPTSLVRGKIYTVIREKDLGWQTNYTLEGIEGEFNSAWFDKMLPTYFALGTSVPVVGKSYFCNKIVTACSALYMQGWKTSKVEKVECLGNNTYKVTTLNSVYLVSIQ